MSEKLAQGIPAGQANLGAVTNRPRRRRKLRRIAAMVAVSIAVIAGAVVGASFLFINHAIGRVHRIPGIAALSAANQPIMPATTKGSMTVLLTGSRVLPASTSGNGELGSSQASQEQSGLIALVHLNAGQRSGAVVSIPPNSVVTIPGHGRVELWRALEIGGPSLLIRSVEQLTNVRINHYSVLDFQGVTSIVSALGGVNVTVPFTFTSDGVTFPVGVNHLTAATILPYVRQGDVSEIGRTLLQQNLIRAILTKIGDQRLFGPMADFQLINDMAAALSVDSNFTNSELVSLMLSLSHLRGHDGVFVSAPTINGSPTVGGDEPVFLRQPISRQLWQAIRHDSVAAFAQRYPFTVTPGAPG